MGPRYLGRKVLQAIVTIVFVVILNFMLFRTDARVARADPAPQPAPQPADDRGRPREVGPRQAAAAASTSRSSRRRSGSTPRTSCSRTSSRPRAGDFGLSFQFRGQSVVDVIGVRFWPTIILIGLAELIAIVVGLALGSMAGWKRGGRLDRVGNGASLILYSMPYFVIGMPLIIIFAVEPGLVPDLRDALAGRPLRVVPVDQLLDFAQHLVLPLATVSLGLIGGYSILMRSSIIETRSEDYVTTARAKGLTDRSILRAHAFPNALLPTVTVIAINLGYVVAGAITAEIVFNWPGLGTLTVDALSDRDYPVLQGIFLLVSVFVDPGQPRRRPDLRPARSAGPDVSATATPIDVRGERWRLRGRNARDFARRYAQRSDGVIGLADPRRVHRCRRCSRPCSSARSRPPRRRRARPSNRRARPTSSGPTTSVGTSSTRRSTGRGSR